MWLDTRKKKLPPNPTNALPQYRVGQGNNGHNCVQLGLAQADFESQTASPSFFYIYLVHPYPLSELQEFRESHSRMPRVMGKQRTREKTYPLSPKPNVQDFAVVGSLGITMRMSNYRLRSKAETEGG